MDRIQARLILANARATGADESDPAVADALAHAGHDPELARWLAQERDFDTAVARKLHGLQPPADLRARILAGKPAAGRTSRSIPRAWWISLAAAAAIVLGVVSTSPWRHIGRPSPTVDPTIRPALSAWHESCLAIFDDPGFALDLMESEYPPLEAFLRERGTRVLPQIPFSPGNPGLVGCKALRWQDQPVSFLCFRADNGELVHLFVLPRGTADESTLASGRIHGRVGPFATISWIQDDLVALVASKMPPEQLDALIAPSISGGPRVVSYIAAR